MKDLAQELLDRYVEAEIDFYNSIRRRGRKFTVDVAEGERRDRLRAEVLKILRGEA